jgi:hypothetical protein
MGTKITLEEFKRSFNSCKNLVPQISKDDIKFLWFDDYYDGMLIGMLEYEGEKFRFEIISDFVADPVKARVFAVLIMAPKQVEKEIFWNQLFQKYVGNHSNLDSTEALSMKPENMHHLFYDEIKAKPRINYNNNFVKYWYEEV